MRHIVMLGLSALVLAGCATGSGRSPKAGRSDLDRQTLAQAAAFEAFVQKAARVGPTFAGPADVDHGLDDVAAAQPRGLESGMIAFAARAALQTPGFAEGVRKTAARRRGLARRLAAEPTSALELPVASAAAGRARGALDAQGNALAKAGGAVRKASYDVQRQSWAKAPVADPGGRLARVKSAGGSMASPGKPDAKRPAPATVSPVVARGVAVAALSVLGEGGRARALLSEPRSGQCLRLARLNFHQCLASAGPYFEDIYCLGHHAMAETGRCVVAAAKPPLRRAAIN
jgi:hypothetical protein